MPIKDGHRPKPMPPREVVFRGREIKRKEKRIGDRVVRREFLLRRDDRGGVVYRIIIEDDEPAG